MENLNDNCCRLICSVEKKDDNFILLDSKNIRSDIINEDNIIGILSDKSKAFWENRNRENDDTACDSHNYIVWILKAYDGDKAYYINIASSKSLDQAIKKEINVHIRDLCQLSENGKYRDFLKIYNKVEFIEIDVDKYFKNYIDNDLESSITDPYIRSLVSSGIKPKGKQAKLLWGKNRAEFIEGKLAYEYGMTGENHLWHRSSMGIDGYIYDYYSGL